MIDYLGYQLSVEDKAFLDELIEFLIHDQTPVVLACNDFSFQVEPYGNRLEVWRLGSMINRFDNIEELFLNFKINGKPFIEVVSDIEYSN